MGFCSRAIAVCLHDHSASGCAISTFSIRCRATAATFAIDSRLHVASQVHHVQLRNGSARRCRYHMIGAGVLALASSVKLLSGDPAGSLAVQTLLGLVQLMTLSSQARFGHRTKGKLNATRFLSPSKAAGLSRTQQPGRWEGPCTFCGGKTAPAPRARRALMALGPFSAMRVLCTSIVYGCQGCWT